MVRIMEAKGGYEVHATGYAELFRNRFKALMAAHALALGESGRGS